MSIPQIPDTLVFKALINEIREIHPGYSAIEMLHFMCDSNRFFAEDCEYYYFVQDDNEITEDEAFLLEWVKVMEKDKAETLRKKLLKTARHMDSNATRR